MIISVQEMMDHSGVSFGTSGARGLVSAMSDKVCYVYTLGFLSFLSHNGQFKSGDSVAVAMDLRSSSPRIQKSVFKAIATMGGIPIDCGHIPTPALALYGFDRNIATIMITGSHIPDDRNGIKFNKPNGELLKEDEPIMLSQDVVVDESLFTNDMFIDTFQQLLYEGDKAQNEYINRYKDFFGNDTLKGLNIGIYQHSAVGRDMLASIMESLGANTLILGRSEKFVPVDTEAIRTEDVLLAKKWCKEYTLDAIVSTDGDSDRPLLSDEKGEWLKGDTLGILTSSILKLSKIALPISCTTAAEQSKRFSQIVRTKIGSPYVVKAMIDGELDAGFEANGGFLLNKGIDGLKALPTRDAFLPVLTLLSKCNQEDISVSTLMQTLPQRFTQSGLIKNVSKEQSENILDKFAKFDQGMILEGYNFSLIDSKNTTDGLRFKFQNGEIIHFRQSGNAPEMRVYVESDNKNNAEKILDNTLKLLKNI